MPLGCAQRVLMGGRPKFYDLLYDEGTEVVDWVNGHSSASSTGSFARSKEADHLRLFAYSSGEASHGTCAYVTDEAIDLTKYSKLKVEWLNVGSDNTYNESHLIASTTKMGTSAMQDARHWSTGAFALTTAEADITALTGDHFIRVHAYASGASHGPVQVDLEVYKVWLE